MRFDARQLAFGKTIPGIRTTDRNRAQGKQFEKMIAARAKADGLLCIRNELAARYIPKMKRMLPVKSNLDFAVIDKDGKSCWLDAKTFTADHFTYSDISPHQLAKALEIRHYRTSAGFLVWFVGMKRVRYLGGLRTVQDPVAWFPAYLIDKGGPRSRYLPESGEILGTVNSFSLKSVFALRLPRAR